MKMTRELDKKITVVIPQDVVDLISKHGYIAKVRDGNDKTKASREAFEAIGFSKLASVPRSVTFDITRRGAKRIREWVDELTTLTRGELSTAQSNLDRLEEATLKLNDAKSST